MKLFNKGISARRGELADMRKTITVVVALSLVWALQHSIATTQTDLPTATETQQTTLDTQEQEKDDTGALNGSEGNLWRDLSKEEKTKLNPNDCDTKTQYIWESDGSCHDKPVAPSQPAQPATTNITGSKQDWLVASGIPQHLWGYVDQIVIRESGWNPNAVNASSGACGLGQQLPCGKWAGAWNDPVAALKAMNGYVNARYGGWAGAVAFWNINHWY